MSAEPAPLSEEQPTEVYQQGRQDVLREAGDAAVWDRLVREAAVLGFAEGAFAAGGIPRATYPSDSGVLGTVLTSAQQNDDLYPALARYVADRGGDR